MSQLRIVLSVATLFLFLTTFGATTTADVPCVYSDTVNLTGYRSFPNGSYLYEGTIIPANLISLYDYKTDASFARIPVEPHYRGCICMVKACIQFCCPLDRKYNASSCLPFKGTINPLMNVTTKQGEMMEENVLQKFVPQIGQPCSSMYYLQPHIYDYDEFRLFENGSLFILSDLLYLSKDEYCLGTVSNYDGLADFIVPLNCHLPASGKTKTMVYACIMLVSVPFMILTIIVYIVIPELRTLHGKSLCCYLLGLCIGYSILSLFILVPNESISQFSCTFWGFLAYFSFMASFFWLSVISFDLFYNIHAPRGRFNENKRFVLYSIYSWGMAFIFLALTFYAQQSSVISHDWKPAIGSDEYCWLNVKYGWSALIYFYGPIIFIICFNLSMFILTALKIHCIQKEVSQMMDRRDSQRSLGHEKDRFGIFLRLFIVMGVTWSMEIISYFIGQKSPWDKIFLITDFCNGIQGLLIFILFVLKKKVKQYITDRFSSTSRPKLQSQYSNRTTSSSINLQMYAVEANKPQMDICAKAAKKVSSFF